MKSEKAEFPVEVWMSLDTVSLFEVVFSGTRPTPILTLSRDTWDDLGNPMDLNITIKKEEEK